ncbi:MAG: hypothetical protein ACUZ77_03980 [Candidatus Brocadiales bacterium]
MPIARELEYLKKFESVDIEAIRKKTVKGRERFFVALRITSEELRR